MALFALILAILAILAIVGHALIPHPPAHTYNPFGFTLTTTAPPTH